MRPYSGLHVSLGHNGRSDGLRPSRASLQVSSRRASLQIVTRERRVAWLQLLEYLHEMLTDIDGVALLDVNDSIECVADEEDG